MSKYSIVEVGRNEQLGFPEYDVYQDDKVLMSAVNYLAATEYVYSVMKKGDQYQEIYPRGKRGKKSDIFDFEYIKETYSWKRFHSNKER